MVHQRFFVQTPWSALLYFCHSVQIERKKNLLQPWKRCDDRNTLNMLAHWFPACKIKYTVLTNNFSCECGGGSESRDPRPPLAQPPGGGGAVRGPAHLHTQPHDHCPAPAAPTPHTHAHQRTDHLTSYYTGDGSHLVCNFGQFIVDKKYRLRIRSSFYIRN